MKKTTRQARPGWEDCVMKDAKAVDLRANWKEVAEDKEIWSNIY